MGLMSIYLKWKRDVVPSGIQKPLIFFKCIYGLDSREWKTAEKIAMEMMIPAPTVQIYLRIASKLGMAERKRDGGVYVYKLNPSYYRFKGVEWIET